ncbi:MAG: cytochrome c oxidase subunit II [Pseudomonadota bacterium]
MALALALVLIVIGTLVFHLLSPWWLTPIASNWQKMDDALLLTLAICAVLFFALNLFIAYALVRFRHRDGRRAAFEHINRKLEWLLIGATSTGIIAMLAPGLDVYAQLIHAPPGAMVFEVMGQQWQWHYRLPGDDGKLGQTDVRFISQSNPFGISPNDPNGQDDRLVDGREMHLPLGRPVKALLRAQDVLHDFYVPQFRTRMNMVPGLVTTFWLTPTSAGRYEVMCAQLCGVGHSNMRSMVVVEDESAFQAWLARQPTFASQQAPPAPGGAAPADAPATQGRLLAQARGCVACHSVDGSAGVGPSWKGLYGKSEALEGGQTVVADDAYLKQSISDPKARIVRGFAPVMPQQPFSEAELEALVAYIKTLAASAPR